MLEDATKDEKLLVLKNKLITLKKNYQFQYVFKKGRRHNSFSFTLLTATSKSAIPKFGFVISKKIGNAVVRNHKRRQLKQIVLEFQKMLIPNQYIFVAKKEIVELSYWEMRDEIKQIFLSNKLIIQ